MSETIITAESGFAAFVALDWADREHAWTMEVVGTGKRERGKLLQTPEAVEAWATELAMRFPSGRIAIAVEQARGALIYALQKYVHLVLYPIHPLTSSKYREALYPSGAKDDPVDADLLLDLLVQQRPRLHPLQLDNEETRKLQMLEEKRRQLVDDRTAQTNRLKDLLKMYFPQVVKWLDELSSPMAMAFLQRWPTLPQLQQQDPEVLRSFFHQHGSRSQKRIDSRLDEIARARPAIEDPAIVEPCVSMVQVLVEVLRVLQQGITRLQKACEAIFAAHPDAPIFDSFPGAGPVLAPRLLVAFGTRRDRWNHVEEFQPYTGIPPVTVRSGNSEWIHFRWACSNFLRQTFHEYAAHSIQKSAWAREFYRHKRDVSKMDHHAAVRALAYKWQRIMFRCWKNRVPYQESIYQQSLLRAPHQTVRPKNQKRRTASNSKHPLPKGEYPVPFRFENVAGFSKLTHPTS